MIEEYNYNEVPSDRVETLVQAIDKIELLKKQLDIATNALYWIAQVNADIDFGTWKKAYNALKQIKELNK